MNKTLSLQLTKRRAIYALLAVLTIAGQYVFVRYELVEQVFEYAQNHENLELDEFLGLSFIASILLMVTLWLRGRDLAREVRCREEAESRARSLARHDALTGLPNRRCFNEELDRRVTAREKSGGTVSVLLLDLDRFKPINDAHGHAVGDLLLQSIADRLKEACEEDEIAARLGGDEFAILSSTEHDPDRPARLARRLLTEIEQVITVEGKSFNVGASIGVAMVAPDAIDGRIALGQADAAMYRAKSSGRNMMAFFEDELDHQIRIRAEFEADLNRALHCDEIVPYFQPLYSISDRRVIGLEILARWRHPSKGIIEPDDFIPIAEDTGLIGDLTWSVLRKACLAAKDWDPELSIALNLSPVQFHDRWLAEKVISVLQETGFPARRLEVEITEAAVIFDFDVARSTIISLKNQGVRIALDDFGTGYSSLRNLRELPFDKVKIDRSFLTERGDSEDDRKVISAIVSLSHSLGLPATAEGVERQGDLEWLESIGCDEGQGFFYSEPVSVEDMSHFLRDDEHAENGAMRSAG